LFVPDGRVKQRQWACNKASCQVERRGETQRRYRASHPEDAAARRLRAAISASKAGEAAAAPRGPPAWMGRLPWEELRDEITPQVFVVAGFFVRLVAKALRDEIGAGVTDIPGEVGQLGGTGRKDETADRPPPD